MCVDHGCKGVKRDECHGNKKREEDSRVAGGKWWDLKGRKEQEPT
jgi:hypothetical protein